MFTAILKLYVKVWANTQQLGVARTMKLQCNFLVHFKVLSWM